MKTKGWLKSLFAISIIYCCQGCEDKVITVDTTEKELSVSILIESDEKQVEPGSIVYVTIVGKASSLDIITMIYSVSGALTMTDTINYVQAVGEASKRFSLELPKVVLETDYLIIEATVISTESQEKHARHELSVIDRDKPELIQYSFNDQNYLPGDTAFLHMVLSDNISVYFVALETTGSVVINDTLRFVAPYRNFLDTTWSVIIPEQTSLETQFTTLVSVFDGSLNKSIDYQTNPVAVRDIAPPQVHVRLDEERIYEYGDTVGFWIIGSDKTSISYLGFQVIGTDIPSDSLVGTFNSTDSVHFEFELPGFEYTDNPIQIVPFASDAFGNRVVGSNYVSSVYMEGRIKMSLAKVVTVHGSSDYVDIVVDQTHHKAYLINYTLDQVEVYSLTDSVITNTIKVQTGPRKGCLTPDRTKLLVSNNEVGTVSIISIDGATPSLDTSVLVSGYTGSACTRIWDIAASTNFLIVSFSYSGSGWCGSARMNLSTFEVTGPYWSLRSPPYMDESDDGLWVFIGGGNSSGGPMYLYDSFNDNLTSSGIGTFVRGVSINGDGTILRINNAIFSRTFQRLGDVIYYGSLLQVEFLNSNDEAVVLGTSGISLFSTSNLVTTDLVEFSSLPNYNSLQVIGIHRTQGRIFAIANVYGGGKVLLDIPIVD